MRWDRRLLEGFARWFASAPGVWQTVIVAGVVVVAERFNPHMDPSGFWLLYWLTVYSGITQPVLAYVGMLASSKLDTLMEHLKATADADLKADLASHQLLTELRTDFTALAGQVSQAVDLLSSLHARLDAAERRRPDKEGPAA